MCDGDLAPEEKDGGRQVVIVPTMVPYGRPVQTIKSSDFITVSAEVLPSAPVVSFNCPSVLRYNQLWLARMIDVYVFSVCAWGLDVLSLCCLVAL